MCTSVFAHTHAHTHARAYANTQVYTQNGVSPSQINATIESPNMRYRETGCDRHESAKPPAPYLPTAAASARRALQVLTCHTCVQACVCVCVCMPHVERACVCARACVRVAGAHVWVYGYVKMCCKRLIYCVNTAGSQTQACSVSLCVCARARACVHVERVPTCVIITDIQIWTRPRPHSLSGHRRAAVVGRS